MEVPVHSLQPDVLTIILNKWLKEVIFYFKRQDRTRENSECLDKGVCT